MDTQAWANSGVNGARQWLYFSYTETSCPRHLCLDSNLLGQGQRLGCPCQPLFSLPALQDGRMGSQSHPHAVPWFCAGRALQPVASLSHGKRRVGSQMIYLPKQALHLTRALSQVESFPSTPSFFRCPSPSHAHHAVPGAPLLCMPRAPKGWLGRHRNCSSTAPHQWVLSAPSSVGSYFWCLHPEGMQTTCGCCVRAGWTSSMEGRAQLSMLVGGMAW